MYEYIYIYKCVDLICCYVFAIFVVPFLCVTAVCQLMQSLLCQRSVAPRCRCQRRCRKGREALRSCQDTPTIDVYLAIANSQ